MRIQLYSLNDNGITWKKDGNLGVKSGKWDVCCMESKRSVERLDRFLAENTDKIGNNEWLLSLSDVFFVPFVRFGNEIEEKKGKKGANKGENQSI